MSMAGRADPEESCAQRAERKPVGLPDGPRRRAHREDGSSIIKVFERMAGVTIGGDDD
jgi:hypothetical protein